LSWVVVTCVTDVVSSHFVTLVEGATWSKHASSSYSKDCRISITWSH